MLNIKYQFIFSLTKHGVSIYRVLNHIFPKEV